MRRTKVYPDIGNWSSIRVGTGSKGCRQAFAIHNSKGTYMAFVLSDGGFFLTKPAKMFHKELRKFDTGRYPETGELKQAVRYAYLLSQKKKL